jgi:hypothetical protein
MRVWCAEVVIFEQFSAVSSSTEITCGPKQLDGEEFKEGVAGSRQFQLEIKKPGLRPDSAISKKSVSYP